MTVTFFFRIPFHRRRAAGESNLPGRRLMHSATVMVVTAGNEAGIHFFAEKTSIN
ncbi:MULTISPECIES: hypothetical protein [Pseudomonas]|jgi:hypothetical protein|uniref:Uncharacterized protein n=2 Tax=Pseudomonas TaxID=286 RepID=A0ABX7GA09_9PSED|nr:hypothetical protein [Pseudomonas granadensis]MBN6775995.1 hypothetical protein [Pseudomonas granadensis]MBN6807639.1 hypothetical protein [Pseudomonas granadensis]MBN6833873.1 hypothetical protein [Pseudomonas granadensis]MBN6841386.1 hypothetical protein [Pseudomonas granadensis]MBN6870061.1 hypothetical protein [Pseudomonas granadensis]